MKYEVAIVGGGSVGATAAIALGRAGFRVALIELRARREAPAGPFDARVSAITRASERILQALGVWPQLPQERIGVFREMHVWERSDSGEIHFDAAEIGEPCLGHIVENQALDYAFGRVLGSVDTLTELRGQRLTSISIDEDAVRLSLEQTELEADLLIGADGSRSYVRESLGIEVDERSYGQRAVVCVVRVERGHQETAWQRFRAGGPIAFLPLPDDHAAVVWSLPAQQAENALELSDDEFVRQLTGVTEDRFGALELAGPRAAFELKQLRAHEYVRERLALIGDAAHTIHPLAGQGVNLGFYDAATLAEVLADARAAGRCFHARHTLRRYERWRKGHNLLTAKTMDFFFSLFGSELGGIEGLRNAGLRATDRVVPLKRAIMLRASGLQGDLPALARAPG